MAILTDKTKKNEVKTEKDLINLNNQILQKKEDQQDIVKIISIRNNVMNYLGIDKFIEMARDIIDECEYFGFISENSRKFIDKETPTFNMALVKDAYANIMQKIDQHDLKNLNDQKNFFNERVSELIAKDITAKISAQITDTILSDEELTKQYESLPTDERRLLTSNMYSVTVSVPAENKIFLRIIL